MAKRIAAGFNKFWYGVVGADGKLLGSTTTAPAAGVAAGSGMARLEGARTLPVNIPEPSVDPVTGDDETLVTFEWDAEELPNGAFEMAVRNNNFEALIQGTKVNTVGSIEVSVLDPSGRASQSICLLLSRKAKSWESGERGSKKWENVYVPQSIIKPLYTTVEQRTFGPYQYFFSTSKADRTGWSTVSETLHGTTAAPFFPIDSDNPLHLKRFTGDNSADTFTLDYAPVSVAKTYVFVNDLRDEAISLSGASLTITSPPATDAVIVVLYEVNESDLS